MTDCTHDIPALLARANQAVLSADNGYAIDSDLVQDLAAALETALKNGGEVVRSDGSRCTLRQWAVEQKQRADRAEIALDNERERAERAEAALKKVQAECDEQTGYAEVFNALAKIRGDKRDAALALLRDCRDYLVALDARITHPCALQEGCRETWNAIDAMLAKQEDKA